MHYLSVLSFPESTPSALQEWRSHPTPQPRGLVRLRAICGLSPSSTAPGRRGARIPPAPGHGWARCRQLHWDPPPKSGGNFLKASVVQTGTICAGPFVPPSSLLCLHFTNSLGLLIPLLRHSYPGLGTARLMASGEGPPRCTHGRGCGT